MSVGPAEEPAGAIQQPRVASARCPAEARQGHMQERVDRASRAQHCRHTRRLALAT